jgi:hypothetical protein
MCRARRNAAVLFVLLTGLLLATAAPAMDYCVEPGEPSCINSRYSFDDELSALRCKREVEGYLRKTGDYVACLERVQEAQLQKSSATLSKLNCRIRGTLGC